MKVALIGAALLAATLSGCGGTTPSDDDADEASSVSVSPEAPRVRWKGQDAKNTPFRFVHEGGATWDMWSRSGRKNIVGIYTEVTRTPGYIELKSKDVRLRLCKDKLLCSEGNQGWVEIARGGWVEEWGE